MGIKKIYKSTKTSVQKRIVINKVLNSENHNRKIINVHAVSLDNIGDELCAPYHYFKEINQKPLSILNYKHRKRNIRQRFINRVTNNQIIVGGGGLLNRGAFNHQMKMFEALRHRYPNKKIVVWGVGHNSKKKEEFNNIKNYNINTNSFDVIGTRDQKMSGDYVPCVSCLHPVFDNKYNITQDIGVIFHRETLAKKEITQKFQNYPSISNNTSIKKLINFIGSTETIITDSYHGMYWSMLLSKKVVVVPNSSKFYDFKYDPVYSSFENAIEDSKKAQNYSGILEECREINHKFAEKVFDYLNV